MARLGPAVRRAIAERLAKVAKREAEAALQRSEERMRGILDTVQDVVWSLSLVDWKLLYMSPAGARMFGRPVSDFYDNGQLWLDSVHPDDRARVAQAQQDMIHWGTGEVVFRILRSDGEVRHVYTRAWCAYADGQPFRLEGINTDVTERLQAEESQRESQRLAERNEFKSQFLNMVAHDLNNVVTPMRINLRLLKEVAPGGGTPTPESKAMAMLDRGVGRLVAFLADLLDAARLQSGKLAVRREPVDLVAKVVAVIDTMRPQAVENGVRLETDIPATLPAMVDSGRLDQVMTNLLSNALKFTPKGGVVTVSLRDREAEARIDVADTGIGFAEGDLGRLFQPFSQIGKSVQGKHTGTGLGLFISRGIVEGHGGHIAASSPGPGKGAVFSVWLPKERGPSQADVKPTTGTIR